jgi:Flp pilus assembly protein TadB
LSHHGGVANTCIHGFAPGTCLICGTLAGRPSPPLRPDAIVAPRERRSSGVGLRVAGFLTIAVVALIAVWIVAGFVFAVLRILEVVAVAVVAGGLGWRLGVRHGRHTRP